MSKAWLRQRLQTTKHDKFLHLGTPHQPICIPVSSEMQYLGIIASYTSFEEATTRHRLRVASGSRQRLIKVLHSSRYDTRACSHLFEVYFPHDTWYIVACGLEGCGCATNCARLGPSFICVRSLEQVRAPSTFRLEPCCCMALRTSAPLPWQILVRFRLESFAATEGRLTFILATDLASVCGSPRSGAALFSFLCLSDWINFYFLGKEFNRVAHFFFHIDGKERRRLERRIRAVQS